jgi:hypothetical protein
VSETEKLEDRHKAHCEEKEQFPGIFCRVLRDKEREFIQRSTGRRFVPALSVIKGCKIYGIIKERGRSYE